MPWNDVILNNYNFFEGIWNSCIGAYFLQSLFFLTYGECRLNIIFSASVGYNKINL